MSHNHNHANYQARLDFIQNLLCEWFNLQKVAQIVPIQYDPESPFKYNNFVYRISLPTSISLDRKNEAQQPETVEIPQGTKEFIFRLTNPDAEGMNQKTRVENEVAMISLAASALSGIEPHVVPFVYGWSSAATPSSQGWILQELMPGTPVDESFESMHLDQKKSILAQMAKFLKALQDFALPEIIIEYGGVTFDDSERIVNTSIASVSSEPWPSGVPKQFESLKSKHDKAIVHTDFTPNNLLYDVTFQRITALIDYDFACILHPSYEFLRSFSGAGGQFQGWLDVESSEQTALRGTTDGEEWDVAQAWEDELEKLDVKRPRTMKGIEKVAEVDAVLGSILP